MTKVYVERQDGTEYWDDQNVYQFVVDVVNWGLTIETENEELVAAYSPGAWLSVWQED